MGVFELYSKRLKKAKQSGQKDIYIYDDIPETLRVQIVHIWNDTILDRLWEEIHNIMARELGVFQLAEIRRIGDFKRPTVEFFLEAETEQALDLIELTFFGIDRVVREASLVEKKELKMNEDDAIDELNYRFRDHNIGYEFINGKIVRIDSELIHSDIVKPALNLLYDEDFEGANSEFLKAHEHYRKGNYKESIAEALKAFESTMKTICKRCNFNYDAKDTASKLIGILIYNELFPSYLNTHFTGLRTTLEAGLPTIRNKTSGHGQGEIEITLPSYMASYAINLAATNIVFLVNAYKELQKNSEK